MAIGFLIQFAASLAAVAALVVLAAWLGLPKDISPLTEEGVRSLLAEEGAEFNPRRIWIAADGRGAVARNEGDAAVIFRLGDGHVIRAAAWSQVQVGAVHRGRAVLRLEPMARPVRLAIAAGTDWPPKELTF